ncbi:MAG: hypothetical protein HYV97_10645 [Bdellovibrio sp.]|nr:hypothetical protein [Bdellovibrio sp.]
MNSEKKINGLKNTSLMIVLVILAFSIFMATDGLSTDGLSEDGLNQTQSGH